MKSACEMSQMAVFLWILISVNVAQQLAVIIVDENKQQNSSIDCPNTGPCDISCSDEFSCSGFVINCPDTFDCDITCDDYESCHEMTVFGGEYSRVFMHCNGENSCSNAMIDAESSDQFTMDGCDAPNSCIGITLFCPPHESGVVQCTVSGN